ncbi:DNA-binding protein [Kitasatospora sp. NPDC005751]|uniref:helix-turn-helix transcriptional regulator n=1 Tax=Kitasatospora sp. NPDC005751 TaxID=3157064 RepID=UPI0033ED835D
MTQLDQATPGITRDQLLRLPPTTDVETASAALGLGRTTGYALAKANQFPCQVIRAGRCYRVVTADLLRVLLIRPDMSDAAGAATPTASESSPSTSAN